MKAKLTARQEERNALLVKARAGDREAAQILETEFKTKLYIGEEAERLAPPIHVHTPTKERSMKKLIPIPEGLADRVVAAIAERGTTQTAAAREIGVSDPTMIAVLKGVQKNAKPSTLAKVEKWLEGGDAEQPEAGDAGAAPVRDEVDPVGSGAAPDPESDRDGARSGNGKATKPPGALERRDDDRGALREPGAERLTFGGLCAVMARLCGILGDLPDEDRRRAMAALRELENES